MMNPSSFWKALRLCLLAAALSFKAAYAVEVHPAYPRPLEELISWFVSLPGLSGSFEQQSSEKAPALRGRFALAPPNRFRWEVEAPFKQVSISNGREFLIYDPALQQVTLWPLEAGSSLGGVASILADPQRLADSFELAFVEARAGKRLYQLEARELAGHPVKELTLIFEGALLAEVRMRDVLGRRFELRFRDVQLGPVSEELFVLKPMHDVEYVRLR